MQIDVGRFFGDSMPPELTWLPRAAKKSLVGAGEYEAGPKGSALAPPGFASPAWHGGILQLKLVTGA